MKLELDKEWLVSLTNTGGKITIATAASSKEKVGFGVTIQDSLFLSQGTETMSGTLGWREEQSPYSAELTAVERGLKRLAQYCSHRSITVVSRSLRALQAIHNPKRQSGQATIHEIYNTVGELRKQGNKVTLAWIPKSEELWLQDKAKNVAKGATKKDSEVEGAIVRTVSTTANLALAARKGKSRLPEGVGKWTRAMDKALPGKHTRLLYDGLTKREASILAQLRTNKSKLRGYLSSCGAVESGQCECGRDDETVEYFLLKCRRWQSLQVRSMEREGRKLRPNLAALLGGKKHYGDDKYWAPDLVAVKATIQFAVATRRFDSEGESSWRQA